MIVYCLLTFMIACDMIQNVGPHFEMWNAGVLGPINLNGLNEGRRDLTWQKWTYKVCTRLHGYPVLYLNCLMSLHHHV